jgi:hypothetical protein
MLKGTKLYSIFNNKCPKCHQGDFFVTKSAYEKDFIKMHDKCEHCGEIFNKEVGFFLWSYVRELWCKYYDWHGLVFINGVNSKTRAAHFSFFIFRTSSRFIPMGNANFSTNLH